MPGFDVVEPSEFDDAEEHAAKRYWAGLGVHRGYQGKRHWSEFMADQVLALKPRRVLELGCNVGRNLAALRDRAARLTLLGVDINAAAVEEGRRRGLPLIATDEGFLEQQPPGAFDVIFTVSVLDHIPAPQAVLDQMLRVARIGVLLLEPWVGREGKVVRNPDPQDAAAAVDTTPYSYSWDYEAMLGRIGRRVEMTRRPYPLSNTNLGPSYELFRILHPPGRRILLRLARRRPAGIETATP